MKSRKQKSVRWESEHLRALRHHLGMTQQEMADELGTRQQTISEWETGMYKPRGTSATLLAIIAERSGFDYQVHPRKKPPKDLDRERG